MLIKSKKDLKRGIEIDLTGPDGNAYCLFGAAKNLADQLGRDGEEIIKRMKEGDYENLLMVFEKEFGDFVTLYR